jgi:hypothetical protein
MIKIQSYLCITHRRATVTASQGAPGQQRKRQADTESKGWRLQQEQGWALASCHGCMVHSCRVWCNGRGNNWGDFVYGRPVCNAYWRVHTYCPVLIGLVRQNPLAYADGTGQDLSPTLTYPIWSFTSCNPSLTPGASKTQGKKPFSTSTATME